MRIPESELIAAQSDEVQQGNKDDQHQVGPVNKERNPLAFCSGDDTGLVTEKKQTREQGRKEQIKCLYSLPHRIYDLELKRERTFFSYVLDIGMVSTLSSPRLMR